MLNTQVCGPSPNGVGIGGLGVNYLGQDVGQVAVSPYMIVCLYGVLCRWLQSRTGAGEDGASSFTL